ncbi:guanine nucleotide-binding protein g(o) subunit alpha [Anaeramoeba ignava]|uniref:Guanine nucleotide-binding protein g(O) subunit alpha n=1 Tax=Anaeramoeba ignava TaxID=1746090 RepID=A0A9Q0L589_ANAIG|nr:guanine nucleotide-binding protein g(o) subunit alpha [Anaeramoeba ignava]
MGCFGSKNSFSTEDNAEAERNKQLENLIKKSKNKFYNEIRILLLGAGESGKSTLFKQMKLIQDGTFSEKDIENARKNVYRNCVEQMKIVCFWADRFGIPVENSSLAEQIKQMNSRTKWSTEIGQWIQALWKDPGIQKTFENKQCQNLLIDSAKYFFDNIERISSQNYVPNNQDILRARKVTVAAEETKFNINGFRFSMIDVGGQRNERRKWIHSFEGVTSVIFCASLSGYNQTLSEDQSINRMKEALSLFREICTSPWFAKSSIILFLNKMDIFEEKIKKEDLTICFPEYSGKPNDYDEALEFIKQKFEDVSGLKGNIKRRLYITETCAINTKNIEYVFESASDTILRNALGDHGFL